MAKLVMVHTFFSVNANGVVNDCDITVNSLRDEAIVCNLGLVDYVAFYLNGKIPNYMNINLMIEMKAKVSDDVVILVEPDGVNYGHSFIVSKEHSDLIKSILEKYAEKNKVTVNSFSGNILEQMEAEESMSKGG